MMLSCAFALQIGAEHRHMSPDHGGCIGVARVLGPHLPCKSPRHGAHRQPHVLGEYRAGPLDRQQAQDGVDQHGLWGKDDQGSVRGSCLNCILVLIKA